MFPNCCAASISPMSCSISSLAYIGIDGIG
jgi:hypothetical protein